MKRLILILGCLGLIFLGIYGFLDRSYYVVALSMLCFCFLMVSISFEQKHLKAREVVLLATLAGLATVARAAFFMLPQVKPVAAIVIITGASLGAEAGFFVGALAGFASNFIFGQGPWTPWQMFAFGMVGFLAGILFANEKDSRKKNKVILSLSGFLLTLLVYGLIMDTASAFMMTQNPTGDTFLALYASGFLFNVIHGASTAVFLWILGNVMFEKLDRIKRRYGMFRDKTLRVDA